MKRNVPVSSPSTDLSVAARTYLVAVIVAGAAAMVGALSLGTPSWSRPWWVYLALTAAASCFKVRLPGMSGTYSLGFLATLYGLAHFAPAETIIAGCAGVLAQSLVGASKRPRPVQLAFNMGAASLVLYGCFMLKHLLLAVGLQDTPVALMSAMACGYFVVNTLLVAGVLALVERKSLRETFEPWYVWPLPYYLLGAVLVGLTSWRLGSVPREAWLLLLPAAYLIHFFIGLGGWTGSRQASVRRTAGTPLLPSARLYLATVLVAGACLCFFALNGWESQNELRFAIYFGLAVVASTLKIKVPGIAGTLSVSFVPVLAAIAQLGLPEVVALAITAAAVQTLWKSTSRPRPRQLLFNAATLSLGAAASFAVCRLAAPELVSRSPVGFLVLSTAIFYVTNTVMVAVMLGLIERATVRTLWQRCHFWTFPWYLVGAGVAGMMTGTARPNDLLSPVLVLLSMVLVHACYRAHLGRVPISEQQSTSL